MIMHLSPGFEWCYDAFLHKLVPPLLEAIEKKGS